MSCLQAVYTYTYGVATSLRQTSPGYKCGDVLVVTGGARAFTRRIGIFFICESPNCTKMAAHKVQAVTTDYSTLFIVQYSILS